MPGPPVRAAPSPAEEMPESTMTTQGTRDEPRFSRLWGAEEQHLQWRRERLGWGRQGASGAVRNVD